MAEQDFFNATKISDLIDPHVLVTMYGIPTSSEPHVADMLETLHQAFTTFADRNRKYDNSWLNDGLDARALFVEMTAKHRRLKALIWDKGDLSKLTQQELVHIFDTMVDTIVYSMLAVRRITLEVPNAPQARAVWYERIGEG